MNKKQVKFLIRQSIEQLEASINNLDNSDTDDDLALASDMTTALNYLFAAWKFRDMASEKLSNISQETYDSAVFTFPSDLDPRFNNDHRE